MWEATGTVPEASARRRRPGATRGPPEAAQTTSAAAMTVRLDLAGAHDPNAVAQPLREPDVAGVANPDGPPVELQRQPPIARRNSARAALLLETERDPHGAIGVGPGCSSAAPGHQPSTPASAPGSSS